VRWLPAGPRNSGEHEPNPLLVAGASHAEEPTEHTEQPFEFDGRLDARALLAFRGA